MDHPWRIVFWALLFDWVEEGNGRLVEVEREYWEAMSEGIVKVPAGAPSRRERRATGRRTPLQLLWLRPVIVVEDGQVGVTPRLKLDIHRVHRNLRGINRLVYLSGRALHAEGVNKTKRREGGKNRR
jgi:hypothetical protein